VSGLLKGDETRMVLLRARGGTPLGFGSDANATSITTDSRLKSNVADAKSVTGLTAKVLRDDGVVGWVNGKLAVRDNMPESDATFCARLGASCGSATQFDNCGATRTVASWPGATPPTPRS